MAGVTRLSPTQKELLLAITAGYSLKAHRYLDGSKVYQLHALDGSVETVQRTTVEALCEHGLLDSNKKFPAATYWLTAKGQALAAGLEHSTINGG
jgi:hypothetical protein